MRTVLKGGTMIAPVPAVIVTCSHENITNAFTVAWTGIINTRPPMTYISVRPERFSYDIIKNSGEFVINLTTSKMAKITDYCGMKSGKKTDKMKRLETVPSSQVDAPTLSASPVALECKVRELKELGSHTMFMADIVAVTADERYIDSKGKINLEQAGLMAYAHGKYYSLGRKLGDFGFSVRK